MLAVRENQPDRRPAGSRNNAVAQSIHVYRNARDESFTQKRQSRTMMNNDNNDPLSKIKHKLQEEIDTLEHELNLELPKELMKARAHGDLSENAEYKYAKERQGFVSARLGQLKKRMGDLGMLNLSNIPRDRAGYGSRVWLRDVNKASEVEYKLVTSEEADAAQGLISTTSPIGRALLGRRKGDEVQVQTPAGIKEFELIRLKTIHEDA
jgi:transcription elongation factor GreA